MTVLYHCHVVCTGWLLNYCVREESSYPETGLDCYTGSQESSGSQESLSYVNVNELVQVRKSNC